MSTLSDNALAVTWKPVPTPNADTWRFHAARGGMYPEVYEKPAPQTLLFPEVEGGMYMDDARLKLSHEEHCRLAILW